MSARAAQRRLVLGIETSCDETAAAVVENGRTVRSNVVASQHELHEMYRGVVPEIASRAHAERLLPVVRDAVREARVTLAEIHAVAVGNRPGLIGSLLVGVAGAKALAYGLGVPLVGVDHVRAHLVAGLIGRSGAGETGAHECEWPALGLIVSGGHTSMYVCESTTRMTKIGGTIDDAMGEAFDKVAAILGLAYPGGPSIDRMVKAGQGVARAPDKDGFAIARIAPGSLDFSFSGLKTAAMYAFRGVPETEFVKAKRAARGETAPATWSREDVAATFQRAAVETIRLKLERALDEHPGLRGCCTLLVGGGVSANAELRSRLERLAHDRGLELRLPAMEFCVDNAAMIAAMGHDLLLERGWMGDDLSLTASPTTGS